MPSSDPSTGGSPVADSGEGIPGTTPGASDGREASEEKGDLPDRESESLEEAHARLRSEHRELRERHQQLQEEFARVRFQQADLVNSARLATLGSLVAGIAHELHTPLGALSSSHDLLRRSLDRLQAILADEQVDETELDDVRRIVRALDGVMESTELAVDRMVGLVGSLRSFGRPDAAEMDRVDLHDALDDTLQLLEHETKDRIQVQREYGKLPRVECFPSQLNQLFMNLLLNACHAIDGEGTITVKTQATDGQVEVAIRDTGCGIDEEDQERIFEPGFTTKGSRTGMGLGLLICRQVTERHGGEIQVDSSPGEGSTFTVTLPLELPESDASGEGWEDRAKEREEE